MSEDRSYYMERANQERRRAMAARDSDARRIHLELAAKYAMLAGPDIVEMETREDQKRVG